MSAEDQDEHMEMGVTGTEETMDDQRPPRIPPRNTSVIVSVIGDRSNLDDVDTEQSSSRSATASPSFSPIINDSFMNQRLIAKHLQVRQTLSEPSKARLQRPKHHRMSPIPKRNESALTKTLSMDGSVGWPVVGSAPSDIPHSPTAMDSTHSSDDSLNTNSSEGRNSIQHDTPTPTPPGNLSITKLTASPLQMSPAWVLPTVSTTAGASTLPAVITSQEQLEALQQKQLDMLTLIEQQKHLVAASGGKLEMFQFPITLWPLGGSPIPSTVTPTTTISATPSPTPSLSSNDSGFQSISEGGMSQGHRPLSGSQSAPHGLKQPMTDAQYEALLRQFQLQHQSLVLQQQQLYQHYLEQQQRVVQQAVMEKKRFEEQQRQLAGIHLEQQQQLHRQQQLLRQMQEQQLQQLQRQQQLILLQTLGVQQQHQASLQTKTKPPVHRLSTKESLSLPYSTSGGGSSHVMESEGAPSSAGLSPNLIHTSLSATSSIDSIGSNNGRNSPNAVISSNVVSQERIIGGGTGLVYDTMMLKHNCCCGSSHPEHPGRLQSIWARLHETGIVQKCTRLRARKASLAELQSLHSENHVKLYGRPNKLKTSQDKKGIHSQCSCPTAVSVTSSDMAGMRAFVQLSCGGAGVDTDTYWNDQHTSNAARMAVGSIIELADKIVSGEIVNGLALVRPPGHHALPNQAMAFCYFNNVALAAKAMVAKNKRVAIVDWDIHHGNGIQQIFYDNPAVLFISIHRYDNGTFFPGTGRPEEIGSGGGTGFNVNIAFNGKQTFQGPTASNYGDPEYLAAFRSIVVPIIKKFDPDIILVSAGFNATNGHPSTLGGYNVTPKCFAHLTRMLMSCGSGKVALSLEGGYELMSLCESSEACMRALLFENLPPLESSSSMRAPQSTAVTCMEKTITCHKPYWSGLHQSVHLINMSHSEAERCDETVAALASLSMSGSTTNATGGKLVDNI